VSSCKILFANIEYLITSGDTELGFRRVDLREAFCATGYAGKFRLQMAIGKEHEIEISRAGLLRRGGCRESLR